MLMPSALQGKSANIFNALLGFTAANVTRAVNLWNRALSASGDGRETGSSADV
jgi:hypothetical protein